MWIFADYGIRASVLLRDFSLNESPLCYFFSASITLLRLVFFSRRSTISFNLVHGFFFFSYSIEIQPGSPSLKNLHSEREREIEHVRERVDIKEKNRTDIRSAPFRMHCGRVVRLIGSPAV